MFPQEAGPGSTGATAAGVALRIVAAVAARFFLARALRRHPSAGAGLHRLLFKAFLLTAFGSFSGRSARRVRA